MHRERLLKLLEILIKYTDMDHKLTINEIVDQLNEQDILVSNRKTLYEDFKLLSKMGYEIEYDNGYYVGNENNPFLVYVKPKNTNKEIWLNENTKVVVGDSFRDFGTIESIYIPESVIFIGYYLTNGKINNIYYEGTKQQWEQIKIDDNNEFLLAATITYEYKL